MKHPSVATIGCFDGVHKGHQQLIAMVVERAKALGITSRVITFDRLPRQLFDPSFRPQLLSTIDEKVALLQALGVDEVSVLPFNHETAALSAHDFMATTLKQLKVRELITGYDNRFGHDRTEGFEDYVRYGQELGIVVTGAKSVSAPVMADALPLSSSRIRQLLGEDGRVELMPTLLGRRYQLRGTVEGGEHIGRELGFPTANLRPDSHEKLIPAPGVYAVWTEAKGLCLPAMMNIGTRPTFEGHRQTLEAHLLHFDGNLYGERLTVSFVARIRSEQRFESAEALVRQLQEDKQKTLEILA